MRLELQIYEHGSILQGQAKVLMQGMKGCISAAVYFTPL